MEKALENIVAYATKSPENTNPNVLRSMLMELVYAAYDSVAEIINNNNNDEGNGTLPK